MPSKSQVPVRRLFWNPGRKPLPINRLWFNVPNCCPTCHMPVPLECVANNSIITNTYRHFYSLSRHFLKKRKNLSYSVATMQ